MNKMKTVDLGTLNWRLYNSEAKWLFYSDVDDGRRGVGTNGRVAFNIDGYSCTQVGMSGSSALNLPSMSATWDATNNQILIRNENYTTAASFKAAMQGVILTYETIDSVEEKIVSYHAPQLIDWTKYTNSTGKGITYTNKGNGLFNVSGKLNEGQNYATYYFDKGRDGRKIKSKIGHIYACGISRIGSKRDVKNSGIQGVVSKQVYFDAYSVYIFEALSNNSDINFYVNVGSVTEQLNQDFYPYFLDLTELYGAGNEPRNATFLQQHPEYNSYVPFYDGPINTMEVIQ